MEKQTEGDKLFSQAGGRYWMAVETSKGPSMREVQREEYYKEYFENELRKGREENFKQQWNEARKEAERWLH